MPPLTRWFLKSALAYLVVSLLIGVTLAGQEALGLPSAIAALNPVYVLMVGFVAQIGYVVTAVPWSPMHMDRLPPLMARIITTTNAKQSCLVVVSAPATERRSK